LDQAATRFAIRASCQFQLRCSLNSLVRDEEIQRAIEQTNWDLLACSMPSNVLLLSGYWPAAGYSLALAARDGRIVLIVPEDEDALAEYSWADEVATYTPIPLDRLVTAEEPIFEAFADLKKRLSISADRIGFEQAEAFEPAGYAPHLFRGSAARLVRRAFPSATLAPADELLAQMRAVKTLAEIGHIRTACGIAGQAFLRGSGQLHPGLTEVQVAASFRTPLSSCLSEYDHVNRCDGFTFCMSGPNSASAHGPYSRSRSRTIERGDLVIVRCHSYADGYWADAARTYHIGPVHGRQQAMYEAVFAARDAVLPAIRAGVRAAELDRVARAVFESHDLGRAFKHPTGHGAGFRALDHTARPRIHPKSEDVLEAGMILKLEPGAYLEDYGGVRIADMVAVTEQGAEVLTPFQWNLADVSLDG
jgi:Xaa-Pro aminopeptidase